MQVSMRYSSGIEGSRPGDMVLSAVGKSAWHDVGRQLGSLVVILHKTLSESGTVRLASPDWRDEPMVDFNLLTDHRDVVRLMDGFRRAAAIQLSDQVKSVTSNPFPTSYSDRMRKAGAINRRNGLRMAFVSRLLDANATLRSFLMRNFIMEGYPLDELVDDDEKLEDFIRSHAVGAWHAACTCRMGRADDEIAALDSQGRVKGVEGLRVVDASIFPVIPCANTNIPTIMAAEKIAAAMG
jgi:5-(hydroxymethyl)furfural/furfural oxidase